ncbi:MAG TPA: HEPN domain-containing protein [Acidimicrobiales bacterium]|nr:HEPN domain-containing protein [Acidimicrobiales bacterium]
MREEWLGVWWRAGSDTRVGGNLVLDDKGGKLVLFGSFFDWTGFDLAAGVGFPLGEPQTIAVIHGRTIDPVSVLSARCDFPVPPGAEGFEGWHAEAVVGAHVKGPEGGSEPTFTGVQFELESLPAWSRARGVAQRYSEGSRTEVVVQPHGLAACQLPSGEEVSIEQWAVTSEEPLQYQIRQPVKISIQGTPPATWKELLNRWLQPLQVLLWLATGVAGRVEQMEVRLPRPEEHSPKWAKLWASLVEPALTNGRELHPSDVLFFADELPGGFGVGLAKWLSVWDDLRHVLGPLYARASAPFAYANDRFYTAVAAIEAYHRYYVESEQDLPRVEHRERVARIERIVSEQAPDLRDWAVNAVQPFNRIPLWQRIVDIAERLPDVSSDLFGSHLHGFAKAVEEARNGHAHALEGSRAIESGEGLYVSADALVWLLRACVLVDLGLDSTQSRIRQHERFGWTTRRLHEVLRAL